VTDSEMAVFQKLQAIGEACQLTYKIREEELSSTAPMDIDSLEFMTFLIEIQAQFSLQIPDEEVEAHGLKVMQNLVKYLSAARKAVS
jgi:acyl carrier protein